MEQQPPPKTDWKEWAKSAVLLCMGIYAAFLIFSGTLANYINTRFAWLTTIAVILFLMIGGMSVFVLIRGKQPSTYTPDSDYEHTGLSWNALMIGAIPLFIALFIPAQPLGVEAVSGGVSLNPVGIGSVDTFTQNPLDRNILDWLRLFNETDSPAVFDGEEVEIIGFVYREPSYGSNQFMVARFSLSCCVADAFAIGLPVELDAPLEFDDGEWVRVRGILQAGQFDGNNVPIIIPATVEPVDAPENPYLYS